MKKNILILSLLAFIFTSKRVISQNTVSWVSISESHQWIKHKSIAILVHNDSNEQKTVNIKIGGTTINPSLKPNTFNTFLIK